jgi:hypothetical protein
MTVNMYQEAGVSQGTGRDRLTSHLACIETSRPRSCLAEDTATTQNFKRSDGYLWTSAQLSENGPQTCKCACCDRAEHSHHQGRPAVNRMPSPATRWYSLPVQAFGRQVQAVGPGNGTHFRVDPYLREMVWVVEIFEQVALVTDIGHVHVSNAAVAERKPQVVVTEHLDIGDLDQVRVHTHDATLTARSGQVSGRPALDPRPGAVLCVAGRPTAQLRLIPRRSACSHTRVRRQSSRSRFARLPWHENAAHDGRPRATAGRCGCLRCGRLPHSRREYARETRERRSFLRHLCCVRTSLC